MFSVLDQDQGCDDWLSVLCVEICSSGDTQVVHMTLTLTLCCDQPKAAFALDLILSNVTIRDC